MTVAQADPGSFRDPDSRVFVGEDRVLRALSPAGLDDFEALARTQLFARLQADGSLVATEPAEGGLPAGALPGGTVAGVLRHERLPFVSYPYEWTFSMLRDAALLQLDCLLGALDEGLILKDASPYNVQWRGTRPVFVDVGSFERRRDGEAWAGYRQFCMLFLYPLLLQAHRGIDPRPWLRGSVDGITPAQCAAVFSSWRDLLRRGVLAHVRLHARMERRHGDRADVRTELDRAGFNVELIRANVKRLRRLVERLSWDAPETVWTGYGETTSYAPQEAERKERLVREALGTHAIRLAWDLGANDGRFSRIAARSADTVVAIESDAPTADALYRALAHERDERILPLCVDLADPSPGLGWRGLERRRLEERGRPDLVLALAVIHHLTIAHNVPVADALDWLAGLDATLVLEVPSRTDPMVEKLLAGKRPGAHPDYDGERIEALLAERMDITAREPVSPTRMLYLARPRG